MVDKGRDFATQHAMGKRIGSRNKASIELEQRCVELAKKGGKTKGLTAPQIAAKVGICSDSVYRILRRAGVRARSTRDSSPLANRTRVLRMVARLGAEPAAAKLGVSRQAIYDRIAKWAEEAS